MLALLLGRVLTLYALHTCAPPSTPRWQTWPCPVYPDGAACCLTPLR